MKSTTERSAIIRSALKALGYTSRDVSVKSDYYSMGSSIRVSIKRAAVPLALVERIAHEHESIDRDQFGDILSGGNRFVFVSYSQDALTELAKPYIDAVQRAVDATPEDNSRLTTVEGTAFMVGRRPFAMALWSEHGHLFEARCVEELARGIAIRLQKGG